MRSIEPLPSPPVSGTRLARPAEPLRALRQGGNTTETAVILPRLRPTRSLAFLAQYLAQEIIGPEDSSPRWRERDSAYRSAAGPGSGAAQISIEA